MNSNGLPWDQERELLRFKQELKGSFVSASLVTGLSQRLLQGSEEEEMLLDGEGVLRERHVDPGNTQHKNSIPIQNQNRSFN